MISPSTVCRRVCETGCRCLWETPALVPISRRPRSITWRSDGTSTFPVAESTDLSLSRSDSLPRTSIALFVYNKEMMLLQYLDMSALDIKTVKVNGAETKFKILDNAYAFFGSKLKISLPPADHQQILYMRLDRLPLSHVSAAALRSATRRTRTPRRCNGCERNKQRTKQHRTCSVSVRQFMPGLSFPVWTHRR
jgi:hypothetical protein